LVLGYDNEKLRIMLYREYLTRFTGKRGQLVSEGGKCKITFYADRNGDILVGDVCKVTGSLDQSLFCETDPGLKSTEAVGDCKIIEVHDDFVLIEYVNGKGSKDIKAAHIDSLIITFAARKIT